MTNPKASGLAPQTQQIIDKAAVVVCTLGLIFAATAGFIKTRPVTIAGSVLLPVDGTEPEITGSGFAPNAVFSFIAPPPQVTGVPLYGSAVSGDASTGAVKTRWYHAERNFYLLVCGYPANKAGDLYLEVFSPKSGITLVRLHFDENPEYWRLQKVSLAGLDATKVRVVAVDSSQHGMGWEGFSLPFTLHRRVTSGLGELLKQLLLVLLCTACSVAGVLGPGIVARGWSSRISSAVWLPLPGIVILALIGLLAWQGPKAISPGAISRTGLCALLGLTGYWLMRRPLTTLLDTAELKVLGIIVVIVSIAVAKGSYSIGPSGELYRGHIARTLEVGTRGDSRIPYQVVQIIGLRLDPYSDLAESFFAPWNFSHRGPVASLAASPFVLSQNVRLPRGNPDDPWTLFDRQGFAGYRIAMIVLAAGSLFVVFGLARVFLTDDWALLAFLCVASAPFTIHEIYFTWPKLLTGDCVLLGVYCVLQRRFFLAGMAVGFGYLCHPSALVFFPAVVAVSLVGVEVKGATVAQRVGRHVQFAVLCCTGLAIWVLSWQWLNRGHFHQDSFLQYFLQSDPFPFTPLNWVRSRVANLAKTLVPMYSFAFHRLDREALPPDRMPQPWVQFIHQYWSTLPFGTGIVFFPALLRLLAIGFQKAKSWTWLVIMQPFLLFVFYWGVSDTGLMREGLQTWFLGLLLFGVVMWQRHLAYSRGFWTFVTVALGVRGLETLLMLIPFTAWWRGYALQIPYVVSDFLSLAVMVLGTVLLTRLAVSHCWSMRLVAKAS